ncbi:MAG TPA: hypothetical protein VFZ78_05690 [Flavisolibacter sp.]
MKSRLSARYVYVLALSAVFLSCKKSDDDEPGPPDFSPMTAGSTWTYQPSQGAAYTLTATNRDTLIGSRNYRVISSTTGMNQYWAKNVNEYYKFGVVPGTTGSGIEELYLKDNQPVNTIWQSNQVFNVPGVPIPIVATLKYTIKGTGLSRTVNSVTYDNVIQVRLDVSVATLGSLGGGDAWYASGVGMIENNLQLAYGTTQIANSAEILTAYHIQ